MSRPTYKDWWRKVIAKARHQCPAFDPEKFRTSTVRNDYRHHYEHGMKPETAASDLLRDEGYETTH